MTLDTLKTKNGTDFNSTFRCSVLRAISFHDPSHGASHDPSATLHDPSHGATLHDPSHGATLHDPSHGAILHDPSHGASPSHRPNKLVLDEVPLVELMQTIR